MKLHKRSIALVALITGATLIPLVAFGGVGLAKGPPSASQYQYSPSGSQYKISVCHRTHSAKHPWVIIRISKSAWPAHQRHGDTTPPPCAPQAASTTTPQNSGDNDNHAGKGNGNANKNNGSDHANGHANGKP